ncbi:MAG: hypothetical protein WAM94_18140 [Chromatiaceae bacterium]
MICAACRDDQHDQCPGGGWCDCQHRSARVAVITPDGEATGVEVLLGVQAPPEDPVDPDG